jgi:hypothetical protein
MIFPERKIIINITYKLPIDIYKLLSNYPESKRIDSMRNKIWIEIISNIEII